MKITVVGTGYVGLVAAACLAEVGNHILGLDVNAEKIQILKEGVKQFVGWYKNYY